MAGLIARLSGDPSWQYDKENPPKKYYSWFKRPTEDDYVNYAKDKHDRLM